MSAAREGRPHRRRRLRLRARVTAAFAVGAMLVSVSLAGLTYEFTRSYLLRQRERSVLRQTVVNARVVRRGLDTSNSDVPRVLDALDLRSGSHPVVYAGGRWYASSLAFGRDALPAALRDEVVGGKAAHQRFSLRGDPHEAVGIPLPGVDAAYFELTPLVELQSTLRTVRNSLLVAAAIATLAGAAVGFSATRSVLAPVHDVARAAAAVAGGRLDTRVEAYGDRDLAVMAHAFNQMTEALQERIRREARFAAAVTHELRSPLMALASATQVVVARRDELPERAQRGVDLLATEVARFQQLTEDMLEISRLDAGAAEPVWEETRLGAFLMHALDQRAERVPVEMTDSAMGAVVRIDKRRLDRVLANVLDNAARYGGGATRVRADVDGDVVTITVDDAGPGIPTDERQEVFERFVRGRRRTGDRGSGSGLGLAIVDEYVRLHGGTVSVQDAPSGGARFVLTLPVGVA